MSECLLVHRSQELKRTSCTVVTFPTEAIVLPLNWQSNKNVYKTAVIGTAKKSGCTVVFIFIATVSYKFPPRKSQSCRNVSHIRALSHYCLSPTCRQSSSWQIATDKSTPLYNNNMILEFTFVVPIS